MSNSSILGGESAPGRAAGRDTDALGPSDSSDSGSDVQGERSMPTGADNAGELGALTVDLDSDSDSSGTGERGAATGSGGRDGGDILPDQIIDTADVDGEVLVDANFTGDIEDDEDGDDDSGDDRDGARDATSAESDSSESGTHAGRTYSLPAGTLEAAEEP